MIRMLQIGDEVRVRTLSDSATSELKAYLLTTLKGTIWFSYDDKCKKRAVGKTGKVYRIERLKHSYINWYSIFQVNASGVPISQGIYRGEELETIKEFKQRDKLISWLLK